MENNIQDEIFPNTKTVYGPVKSWRLGQSVGIDPIFHTSTCSFNCIYCQLGQIQSITTQIKKYVPTKKVLEDYQKLYEAEEKVDVITYSGSGEPTLASNIDEMIKGIRKISPSVPQFILTNATELYRPEVRQRLLELEKIIVKIDAPNEELFQKVNRPAPGISLKKVLKGIDKLKQEYKGNIEVQSMFMPVNKKELNDYINILKEISPNAVQLNTPKRPYPLSWHRENRGNHKGIFNYEVRELKTISKKQAKELEDILREKTGLNILSIYRYTKMV